MNIVHDTLPLTKPATSYHQFGQDLSYKYFLHCCVAVGKITSRGHSAIAELLVWDAAASAGPHANNLHLAANR